MWFVPCPFFVDRDRGVNHDLKILVLASHPQKAYIAYH